MTVHRNTFPRMEEVFLPDLKTTYRWLSLCFVAMAAGIVLATLAFRRQDFPARPAMQLVGLLFALFGALSGGMVLWDLIRTPSIAVGPDYAIIANDTVYAAEIERVYIEPVVQQRILKEHEDLDLGIISYRDKRPATLLADEHYDVKAVIGSLRAMTER